MNPLAIIAISALGVVGVAGYSALPPDSAIPTTFPATVDVWSDDILPEAPQTTLPAPQTTVSVPKGYCPQIFAIAPLVGFTEPETVLLARIAWLESRCIEDIQGDLDKGVSWGILQIHGPSWCQPNRWWPDGYLQAKRVLDTCADLYDPAIAVIAARFIVDEGGFEQWTTYDRAVAG